MAKLKTTLEKLQGEKNKLTFQMNCLEAKNKSYDEQLLNDKEFKRKFKKNIDQKLLENKKVLEIEKKTLLDQFNEKLKEKEDQIKLIIKNK